MSFLFWPGTIGDVRRYAEMETSETRETSLRTFLSFLFPFLDAKRLTNLRGTSTLAH